MSGWQLATDAAIWTLILGSIAVFGWFLAEVVRLARGCRSRPEGLSAERSAEPREEPPQPPPEDRSQNPSQ